MNVVECIRCRIPWDVDEVDIPSRSDFIYNGVCIRCRYKMLQEQVKQRGYKKMRTPDGNIAFVWRGLDSNEQEKVMKDLDEKMKAK